ncbi:MAG: FAD binding domain-containing protein, partial [Geminicoccaceae bacterium]
MRYEAPETFESAVALLAGARGEARVLAGGTDLLVQLRAGLIEPELVVDVKRIPEVHAIT